MLRLAATCPACGRAPAIRVTEAQRRIFQALPPALVVAESYQCQARGCGAWYALHAGHFAYAAR